MQLDQNPAAGQMSQIPADSFEQIARAFAIADKVMTEQLETHLVPADGLYALCDANGARVTSLDVADRGIHEPLQWLLSRGRIEWVDTGRHLRLRLNAPCHTRSGATQQVDFPFYMPVLSVRDALAELLRVQPKGQPAEVTANAKLAPVGRAPQSAWDTAGLALLLSDQEPPAPCLEGLSARLLAPCSLERDANGWLSHPALPVCDEDVDMLGFLGAFGLDADVVSMAHSARDLYDAYQNSNDANCSSWAPLAPAGAGWILIAIFDSEDGPQALFIRRPPRSIEAR
jgi:hypothetical protein